MREFSINEVKPIDRTETDTSELLTGSVIKGLDPNSPIKPNAELERNEYVMFPDGETVEVVGEKHNTGGVKMNIPDGTKIISNFLKLTPKQASTLKKEFDLAVSSKDTYASAMKKYIKSIGLFKLDEEQKELFDDLKKVMDKGTDEPTKVVNVNYLNNKIFSIEQKKKAKDKDKKAFFETLFTMQEKTKPKKQRAEGFRHGGTAMKNFEEVCKKFGISVKEGERILRDGGIIPKFEEAGQKTGDDPTIWGQKDPSAKQQYDYIIAKLKNNPEFSAQLYKEYLETLKDDKQFSTLYKAKGQYRKSLEGLTEAQVVQNYIDIQKRNLVFKSHGLTEQIKGSAQSEKQNKLISKLSKDYGLPEPTDGIKNAQEQLAYISFDKLAAKKREQPEILQNLLQPFEATQFGKGDENTSYKNTISPVDGAYTNTTAGQISNFNTDLANQANMLDEVTVTAKPPKEDPEREVGQGTDIKDMVIPPMKNNMPRLFFTPNQQALPPLAMEAHLKGDIDLQRIDPVRIGIEQNLQEASDQRQFVAEQLKDLPDSQKASALASLLATSQKSVNQAITSANTVNAQNIAQAELFNIQQSGQEEIYGLNNALNFEQRQLTAKAKTDEELRRYYDYQRQVNVHNFENQQKLNLMDDLFPDFNLDFMGASISYAPTSTYDPEARQKMAEVARYLQFANTQPITSQYE